MAFATDLDAPVRGKSVGRHGHVRLPEDEFAALRAAAKAADRSVSDVIRAAIHRYLRGRLDTAKVQALLTGLHEAGMRLSPL
ncbi:ribbon-helix-helix protein, CopG family [Skermania sp. ID1734]|uniref:ribbon-helix-helix protein, CopG family n=1 Tax=Skermania sp. ID1734 TaxID=2597516 RepID=UPI00163DE0D2|nr:ribbon-helix-helix protein, CopG family [Skermania sp. ID1734]